MIEEILKAFIFIFAAEMGDKTQIMAMAFATRFPVKKVLLGIFIGSFLNHGLAVALGNYLSTMIPINTIQMIAGAAFIGFAIWTLKSDDEEEDEESKIRFGPVLTVGLAFFLGELGDKTQLTAISLATDAKFPLMILAGTVAGMVVTGALGIIIGKKFGARIPELGIKFVAASAFMFFGLNKLSQTVPTQYMQIYYVLPFLAVIVFVTGTMVRSLLHKKQLGIQSDFLAKSKELHDYYHHMLDDMNSICLGIQQCKSCKGNRCAIGNAKEIISFSMEKQNGLKENIIKNDNKSFNKEEVLDSLVDTLVVLSDVKDEESLKNIQLLRNQLEQLMMGVSIDRFENIDLYINEIQKINVDLSKRIYDMFIKRDTVWDKVREYDHSRITMK